MIKYSNSKSTIYLKEDFNNININFIGLLIESIDQNKNEITIIQEMNTHIINIYNESSKGITGEELNLFIEQETGITTAKAKEMINKLVHGKDDDMQKAQKALMLVSKICMAIAPAGFVTAAGGMAAGSATIMVAGLGMISLPLIFMLIGGLYLIIKLDKSHKTVNEYIKVLDKTLKELEAKKKKNPNNKQLNETYDKLKDFRDRAAHWASGFGKSFYVNPNKKK